MTFEEHKANIRQFSAERDWLQYHNPRTLSVALAVEAAELMELFQWGLPSFSWEREEEEIADILIYAIRFADERGIDIDEAIRKKMEKNAVKYPTT